MWAVEPADPGSNPSPSAYQPHVLGQHTEQDRNPVFFSVSSLPWRRGHVRAALGTGPGTVRMMDTCSPPSCLSFSHHGKPEYRSQVCCCVTYANSRRRTQAGFREPVVWRSQLWPVPGDQAGALVPWGGRCVLEGPLHAPPWLQSSHLSSDPEL